MKKLLLTAVVTLGLTALNAVPQDHCNGEGEHVHPEDAKKKVEKPNKSTTPSETHIDSVLDAAHASSRHPEEAHIDHTTNHVE